MSENNPAVRMMGKRLIILLVAVVSAVVVLAGVSLLVSAHSDSKSTTEVELLESEPLVTGDIPGLNESELRIIEGGETLGKPVLARAFRFLDVEIGQDAQVVKSSVIKFAEESGWSFEREGLADEDSFRMKKTPDGSDNELSLFVELLSYSEFQFTITVE